MTPTEIEAAARTRYNAIGDSFYSQEMLFSLMYDACMRFATEAKCIRNVYTTDSVAGQDEYEKPTRAIGIVAVYYDGKRLDPISDRERQGILINGSAASTTGTPKYYTIWGEALFLTPTPDTDATGAIKIWSYDEPSTITAVSTIPIPTRYHKDIIYHLLEGMALKDSNRSLAASYAEKFELAVVKSRAFERKLIAHDRMPHVHDVDSDPFAYSGRY